MSLPEAQANSAPIILSLPRLYAIVDASCFSEAKQLFAFAEELVAGGASLLQYRNKSGNAREMLEQARQLKRTIGSAAKLIMNDRADLCLLAAFDGVHVGQEDCRPDSVRKVVGDLWIGVSTHNSDQIAEAAKNSANYVAIGPVFATGSKVNPDPVLGLEGVRRARSLTTKPLVAIGGITRVNCRQVFEAGADSVAVISDLMREPQQSAGDFLRILG
jgi:thiamine-phosphate pyrophosphorylase